MFTSLACARALDQPEWPQSHEAGESCSLPIYGKESPSNAGTELLVLLIGRLVGSDNLGRQEDPCQHSRRINLSLGLNERQVAHSSWTRSCAPFIAAACCSRTSLTTPSKRLPTFWARQRARSKRRLIADAQNCQSHPIDCLHPPPGTGYQTRSFGITSSDSIAATGTASAP